MATTAKTVKDRRPAKFKVRQRKARMARNPRTGEAVRVPARTSPVFKPSKHFRAQVGRLDAGDGSG